MAAFIDILRTGRWLTRERMRLVALAVLAASLIGAGYLLVTADGLNDRLGRPLGTDFSNVYAAGTYVLEGRPQAPFDPALQFEREKSIFGAGTQLYGWHYPPFFLAIAALLATMPYLVALAVWQGVTLAGYLISIRAILSLHLPLKGGGRSRSDQEGVNLSDDKRSPPGALRAPTSPFQGEVRSLWLLLALAFPAVFINLGHGHNGFLTASLFGGALLVLDRRPIVAGILFGLLAYKPQFGVLIPIVLIASGRWRAFAAAAATVAVLTLAVTFAFGVEVWRAFLASTEFTRAVVLEAGDTGWHKIQSVFSVVRMWGGGLTLAYGAQGIVTLGIAISLFALWRSRASFERKAAALLIGTVLATPYSLDYDMMLLAPAIAFLAAGVMTRRFAPWDKTMLAALWIVPLIARSVAEAALIPLGAPAMLLAYVWFFRGAMREISPPGLGRK